MRSSCKGSEGKTGYGLLVSDETLKEAFLNEQQEWSNRKLEGRTLHERIHIPDPSPGLGFGEMKNPPGLPL
jgi:hypothetical protein